MFTDLLSMLDNLSLNLYTCPPDEDDKAEEDSEDTTDDSDSDEDQEEDKGEEDSSDTDEDSESDDTDDDQEADESEEDEADKPKYSQKDMKRVRNENKKRRLKAKDQAESLKALEKENADLKRGRTQADKGKKQADTASSQLEDEIATLKEELATSNTERDALARQSAASRKVRAIEGIAKELGYRDSGDAIALIKNDIDDLTDEDGNLDDEAVRSTLEEILEAKQYLASDAVVEKAAKTKRGKKEASKVSNSANKEQSLEAPDVRKSLTKEEKEINNEIQEAMKNQDGDSAFAAFQRKFRLRHPPETDQEVR